MVHAIEDEEIEVAKVTRNGKVHDLPTAILQIAIMTGPTIQNDKDRTWRIALANEVAFRLDRARRLGAKARQLLTISICERHVFLKSTSQRVGHSATPKCPSEI